MSRKEPGEPATIEGELRHLARQVEHIATTDDPLVILVRGAILIDTALKDLLGNHLVGGLKPFSEYRLHLAGNTTLAHAIGLITTTEKATIDDIRDLRNKAAHRAEVNITEQDENRLLSVARTRGFMTRQEPSILTGLMMMAGTSANLVKPTFGDLRYLILYVICTLTNRRYVGPPKLQAFTPPDDPPTIRGLHLMATGLLVLVPALRLTDDKGESLFQALANRLAEERKKRAGPSETAEESAPPAAG